MATNILMLAYYFPPRGGSGVQRSLKFAKHLPKFDIKPVVLTVDEGEITKTRDDSFFDEIPGVPVYRAPSGERKVKAFARLKLGPFVSLALRPDAHILWKKEALKAADEIIAKHDCKAIYASVQPWSAALIGMEIKKRYGMPLIVDFRDPWSTSTSQTWPTRWHHRRDCKAEESLFRSANALVSVTPGIVEKYKQTYPFAAEKMHLIFNGYDPDDFQTLPEAEVKQVPLRIAFAGRLYSVHGKKNKSCMASVRDSIEYRNCEIDFSTHSLKCLLDSIALLFKDKPGMRGQIVVDVAGNIPKDNLQYAERLGLSDAVVFHGMLTHAAAIDMVAGSDVVFLPMMSEADGRRSSNASGKVFEYLAQSKPVLALIPEGDAADIVRNAGAGWVISPKETQTAAKKLEGLVEAKKGGAISLDLNAEYISQFRRSNQARQLASIVESLTK